MDKVDPVLEEMKKAQDFLARKGQMFDPEYLQMMQTLVTVVGELHCRVLEMEREVGPGNQFVDMSRLDIPSQVHP